MKGYYIIIMIFLFLCSSSITFAEDQIPYNEFVKITEQVLDALDDIEAVFSNDSFKFEANQALKKFDSAINKYKRYSQPLSDPDQALIAYSLSFTRLCYEGLLVSGDIHKKALDKAQETRNLFLKYKKDHESKIEKEKTLKKSS